MNGGCDDLCRKVSYLIQILDLTLVDGTPDETSQPDQQTATRRRSVIHQKSLAIKEAGFSLPDCGHCPATVPGRFRNFATHPKIAG